MIAIQLVSAHIGRVTGKGIAANAKELYPLSVVLLPVCLLVIANTINIAADLAAMGEALWLVMGGLKHEHALIFAATSVLLQVFVPYRLYAPILKFLTLVLFLYVAVAFTIEIPWGHVVVATLLPTLSFDHDSLLLVVAVLGTTISPYLFFWQASQEVEEMRRERSRPRLPLKILTRGGGRELTRISIDTTVGMTFSNLIAYFIILATASTLHSHGITDIQTAGEAAEALRPIAGDLTFLLFRLGDHWHRPARDTRACRVRRLRCRRAVRMAFVIGGEVPGSHWLLHNHFSCDRYRICNGILAHQSHSVARLDRSYQWICRRAHYGGDDVDRYNRQAMGRFQARPSLAWAGWGATALMGITVAALLWSLLP